ERVADLQPTRDEEDTAEEESGDEADEARDVRSRHTRARTPCASSRVRSRSAASPSSGSRPSTVLTRAEPTITPSAKAATSAAWAPVLPPRPTQSGRSVVGRRRATSSEAVPPTLPRAPVTPMVEAV